MECLICGTAAAETIPALFCTCELCLNARAAGGNELRLRAAYQFGDSVRIDWGPDSAAHGQRFGLRYELLRHLLITHSHEDHLYVPDLAYRLPGFSVVPPENELAIYGNESVERMLQAQLPDGLGACNVKFVRVEPYQELTLPGTEFTVVAVEADHDPKETCLNYLLGYRGTWLFQGNDTGWPHERTWEFLKGYRLNTVILDSTSGSDDDARKNHMGVGAVIEACERLEAQGSLAPGARLIATHFSHNGRMTHAQLAARLQPHGIEPAYDGLVVSMDGP